ncbi:TRADD-N-associated membrane domain-containing protein [Leptolyngbya sp. AN02str]|uniref:TRADD-N-associated membrane domain-containing protein n=1 Tax=Leptolyngbya sp. AN02str TaxID=3423363 RepID=UPI003D3127D1
MTHPQKLKRSLLQNFRRRRLAGLLTISTSVLFIAIRQQIGSIWEISTQVFGPFLTNIFLAFPYILLILGFFLYFHTEQASSKLEEKAYLLAQERHRAEPSKAKPVWDMAQLTLESYFNRNLSQIRWIFWLSLGVMSLGFILILYGVALGYQRPEENWRIAAIGSLAGLITEFIGATFLFVYRSSIQQADKYAQILERMNFVGMAMQMLDSIAEHEISPECIEQSPADCLRQAKIDMAKALLEKLETHSPSP